MQNIALLKQAISGEIGDAFIDKPELFKDARDVAKYIADKGNDEDIFSDQLSQLIFRHKALDEFTDGQINTLWTLLDAQVDKHLNLDRVEAAILIKTIRTSISCGAKLSVSIPEGIHLHGP